MRSRNGQSVRERGSAEAATHDDTYSQAPAWERIILEALPPCSTGIERREDDEVQREVSKIRTFPPWPWVILKRSAPFEQHNPACGVTSSSFFHAPSLATAHSNAGIDYKLG